MQRSCSIKDIIRLIALLYHDGASVDGSILELPLLSSSFLCIYCLWKRLLVSLLINLVYILFSSGIISHHRENWTLSSLNIWLSLLYTSLNLSNYCNIKKASIPPFSPAPLFFLSNLVLPWYPKNSLWQQLQVEVNFGSFSTKKIEGKKTKTSGSLFKFQDLVFSLWHITMCSS